VESTLLSIDPLLRHTCDGDEFESLDEELLLIRASVARFFQHLTDVEHSMASSFRDSTHHNNVVDQALSSSEDDNNKPHG
jgi:hypothetical protein